MTDLMETLYQYAQGNLARSLLCQEQEYSYASFHVEKLEKTFRATLDDAQKQHFDALLEEEALLSTFAQKALFRAGLHVAFELFR